MRTFLAWFALAMAVGAGQPRGSAPIGEVKSVVGSWCMKGAALKPGQVLYQDSDVRYCSPRLSARDQIEIEFATKPPYARTYLCTTPGLCDQRDKLWLLGGYLYGTRRSGPMPSWLISKPNVGERATRPGGAAAVPDAVVGSGPRGVRLPPEMANALGERPFSICMLTGDRRSNCQQYPAATTDAAIDIRTGLFGIYAGRESADPTALLLVGPAGSDIVRRWNGIPKSVRTGTDSAVVNERRLALFDWSKTIGQ